LWNLAAIIKPQDDITQHQCYYRIVVGGPVESHHSRTSNIQVKPLLKIDSPVE
jgi:hypothetical protein